MEINEGDKVTVEIIEQMADAYFPIRDENNMPSYRENQRETIIKIAKALFVDDKKFVAVDGPVGCGKSAINYTVSRMTGDTVYLTPLKMLQDQIVSENWRGVKMLKGRNAYACNFCGYESNDYRCDYSGDEFDTCQNTKPKNNFNESTIETVGKKIEEVHSSFAYNPFVLKLRSGFSSPEEYHVNIERMKSFLVNERKKLARKLRGSDHGVEYDYDLEKNVACVMNPIHECPANSSKLLAKMAPIRVLNPDIFFMLTKSGSPIYSNNNLMVYDECQQIEGVIGRIFKIKIPVDTVKNIFGIDMTHLHDIDDMANLLEQTRIFMNEKLGPLVAAASTINRLGDICTVKNFPTLDRMKSQSFLAVRLIECANNHLFNKWRSDEEWTFSILDIINYAFTGKELPQDKALFSPFVMAVREFFIDQCSKYGCGNITDIYEHIIPRCRIIFNANSMNRLRRTKTRELSGHELSIDLKFKDVIVPDDKVFADHIVLFKNTMDPFIKNIKSMEKVSDSDLPAFTIARIKEPAYKACKNTPLAKQVSGSTYANMEERCLEVVPIAIGRLMNMFFYSKANKVLLTSGTWVCPDSILKLYGIPEEDSEFIKIPTTFKPERRKIFVVDNKSFTNFSEKSDYGGYVYKTDEGADKFTLELSSIIKRVRRFIKEKHNKNANVIVHCHTFDIARMIAEHAPDVDHTYLIHLQKAGSQIENRKTEYVMWAKDKNDLIETMKDCPDSGLTIVSPSISEGVDFKGDMARAQIILKRPIPYLGDVYVKSYYKGNPDVGIERDPDFLDRICYTTMTQQYGRVMRSTDDWGYTIIMDQSITWALKYLAKNRRKVGDLNIGYFWEGLQIDTSKPGKPAFPWIFG